MESIIDQQRCWHEEREKLETTMVKEMLIKKSNVKEQINSEHKLKYLLDRHVSVTKQLISSYEDKEGLRKDEISSMTGGNEFSEFYCRLKAIKEYYKKTPDEVVHPLSFEMHDNDHLVDFTAEEGYGKFLDLSGCYLQYRNLKGTEKINYLSYLSQFDNLSGIPKDRKMTAHYKQYLESLLGYLMDYCSRVMPLLDLEEQKKQVSDEFEKQWESGTFPGWPKETSSALIHSGAQLDLSSFSSAAELASLGLDRLKTALMALNLKCGGTLEERTNRLWATKKKTLDELNPNLFAKIKSNKDLIKKKQKELGFLEAQIHSFAEILENQRIQTKENVTRKQAQTAEEKEASDEDDSEIDSEDEPDSEVIYNPKNVPLGWDGKPIPYWLYKLHGLNLTYNCEICGNTTYKGPKAFQLHFAEWRHAHGMRCLGIPNTAHFANITKIEDALKLWNKLKSEKEKEKFHSTTEEFEDSEGRVVNKKTYEDLKKQGLL